MIKTLIGAEVGSVFPTLEDRLNLVAGGNVTTGWYPRQDSNLLPIP